jgi:ABC-type transport system substrate-binding protein
MTTRAAAVAMALAALCAVAGCASAPSSGPTSHTTTSTPSPAASSPSPMLTPTAPARTPLGTGERVWAAFSERGLSHDAWWTHLKPLLSDSAQAVYVYDDPRNIPSMKITDKIHLAAKAPAEPRYTAEVIVPTSKGDFGLDLERHTLRSEWLLYAIKFPPAVQ